MFDVATSRTLSTRELTRLTDLAAGATEADWDRPSRCVGWTVRNVCSHAGLAANRQAEAFRRAVNGPMEPPEFPGAPGLANDQILGLLRDGTAALDAALAGLTPEALEGLTPMPLGVLPTAVAIQISVYEYAFHTDDVAHALGVPGPFPADIAAAYVNFLPGLATMFAAAGSPGDAGHAYRLAAPTGTVTFDQQDGAWAVVDDPVSPLCTISGSDEAVALFAMGRIGAGDARLTVSGPAVAEAGQFKRWFPGP